MSGRGDAGAGAVGTDRPQAGEDWARLKQLLEAALARDPSLRPAFVADACAGDAVLTGSVTRAGRQVTIAVELFRPAGGERSWSGSYDGDVRDIAALQHEVATAVSSEIAVTDGPEHDHASRHGPRSVEAYEAYLRGRHYWNMRSAEAAPRAVDQFNLALELDPLYAQAYAGLADTYVMLGDLLYLMPHEDAFARAEAAARRALELDSSQAEAHASLGHLRTHAWRWAEAERAFDRALGWLGKSLDASDPESMILPVDPRLDGLRGDPRFAALLRRMGLPLK